MFKSARHAITPKLRRFFEDQAGATAIEYAILASGVAVAIAATVAALGGGVTGLYSDVSGAMN